MSADTIDEVIGRLDEIVEWSRANGSRLGYFPALYKRVTEEIRDRIADGYFEDAERMERFDVIFANRYIDAFDAFRRGEACTESWQLAFEATPRWRPLVLQHLLLGMNAHISLDLGIAAAQTCPGDEIESLQADFNRINEVLSALTDEVQRELAAVWPPLRLLDWFAGRVDEALADFGMQIARDAAWQLALDYAPLTTQSEREGCIRRRDAKVTKFGRKLYRPGVLLGIVLWIIRIGELGSVVYKINRLDR